MLAKFAQKALAKGKLLNSVPKNGSASERVTDKKRKDVTSSHTDKDISLSAPVNKRTKLPSPDVGVVKAVSDLQAEVHMLCPRDPHEDCR